MSWSSAARACVIDWTNGEYTPRPPQIHHVRERKINGTIYREDGGFFEGFVQHMYQDPNGNVTVGIGHLIPNAEEAKRFPFYKRPDEAGENRENPTLEEIEEEFNEVGKPRHNNNSLWKFRMMTNLRLDPGYIELLFDADVDGFIRQLTSRLPEFDTYPKMAQLGLLDLLFNLGHDEFFGAENIPGFEELRKALEYRNWIGVAEESHRQELDENGNILGGMVNRNKVIRGWFLQASEDDPFFVNPKCPKKNMNNITWIPDFT